MRKMAYLVEHGGKTLGPFSRDELLQRLEEGVIARADLACDEYHGRWTPLGELLDAEPTEPRTIPPLPGHKRGTFSAIGWGAFSASSTSSTASPG
jgi:hypothetical protein